MTEIYEQLTERLPVTVRRRVRWGDCDPAGVVYTPRFAEYVVAAFHTFLEVLLGAPLSRQLATLDLGTPAKALSFEFKRSLWPDQEFITTARVADIRNRTFDLLFDARDTDGQEVFLARFTAICVYTGRREARPIPAQLREKLEAYRDHCPAG